MNTTKIDKTIMLTLIIADAIAIIISMVAGPLEHDGIAIGTAMSAVIISCAIIIYGLFEWDSK